MYEIILEAAVGKSATKMTGLQRLLASVLSARTTLSITALGELLGLESYDVSARLTRLHSVVHVPDGDDVPGLRTVHASFGDYLLSRAPGHIRIPQSLGHDTLAHGCLELMEKKLYFNISQSRSSYEPNPLAKLESCTLSLEYACMHWAHHITAPSSPAVDLKIDQIFRPRFMFWLELLSVMWKVGLAAGLLRIAASSVSQPAATILCLLTLPQVQEPLISEFLHDANFFVASSQEAIERSAAHIYLSALPFADPDSQIYQQFAPHCSGLVTVEKFGIGHHGGGTVMTLTGHSSAVRSVAYSSDSLLLVSGSDDGTVRVWDTRTGEETFSSFLSGDGSVLTVDVSRNDKWIASGTEAGVVCVWMFMSDQVGYRRLSGHSARVNCVKFAPDGSRLASASENKTACLWNPDTGEQLAVLNVHTQSVKDLAFYPDGHILASCSEDDTIRLCYVNTERAADKQIKSYGTNAIDFSPDGQLIASAANIGVQFLRHKTLKTAGWLETGVAVQSVRFSRDGRSLLAIHGQGVRIWTLKSKLAESPWVDITGHSGAVCSATFSPCGMYIASASDYGTVQIWSTGRSQAAVQPLLAHEKAVSSVAVSPDGNFIFSASFDQLVRVWNARTGEAARPPFRGHTSWVNSASALLDAQLLSTAFADKTARQRNAHSKLAAGKSMKAHASWVKAVSFSNDGQWFASASDDNTVLMWNVETQRSLAVRPLRCAHWVSAVSFSPDNEIIAAGDIGGRIYLWRRATGKHVCEPWEADVKSINSLAFSPNSKKIVAGGNDNGARIWDGSTGQSIPLEGHTSGVLSVAWSLDGCFIATGSKDRTVRLWDAITGAPLARLRGHADEVRSVAFTGDSQYLVSGSTDATIHKWDVDLASRRASKHDVDPFAALASAILEDGWLVGPYGELLLWVPAEYRVYLQAVCCALTIGKSRVIVRAGTGGLHAGPSWYLCWRD